MQPTISIITPSYNQGRYLEENILSVTSQGIDGIEHIVIDGGSSDNSKSIIQKHADKLACWVSEPDKGQSDAVNKGFAKATGEIIGWLNSDDYYSPNALQKIIRAFSNPSVNMVCAASRLFSDGGKETTGVPTVTEKRNLEFHLRFPDINQPATFFRRKIMAEFMPLNIGLHYVMDRELWIKYIQQYGLNGVKTINETVVNFRYHTNSKSSVKEAEFDNEYATILHWFAVQHKLNNITGLLAERYKLLKDYTYPYPKYPDKQTTLNMLRYFLLKRGGLVYTKEQFAFAKKAYDTLDIEHYTILPEEQNALNRIKAIANCANWTHYRIKRKLKLV